VGLMHGIGQFVMHAGMPDAMAALDAEVPPLDVRRSAEERRRFGFDFAQVGAGLARRWKFPDAITAALGAMPAPLEAAPFSPEAALVHVAAWRARNEGAAGGAEAAQDPFPQAVCAKLGIAPAWVQVDAGAEPAASAGAEGEAAMPALAELTRGLEDMLS